MIEDPGLDPSHLAAELRDAYAIEAQSLTFIRGYDPHSASYAVATAAGSRFLKVHFREPARAPLEVPRALLDAGIPNVVAPMPTLASTLSHPMAAAGQHLVLFPFVEGRNAAMAGMTARQWREFGTTLRAIHDSDLAARFIDRLPADAFGLPSAETLRDVVELATRVVPATAAASRLKDFLGVQAGRIGAMLERARVLGVGLRTRSFERVLCHADIHAANILIAAEGQPLLVDWGGPMLAPRERDLLFVIGSRIARTVEPREEAWFFEGYGDVEVDRDAIVFYRYERIFEDIGVDAASVLGSPSVGDASADSQVALIESLFEPGNIIETVEIV